MRLNFSDLKCGEQFYDISIPDSSLSKIVLTKISDQHPLFENMGWYVDEDNVDHVCYLDMEVERLNN